MRLGCTALAACAAMQSACTIVTTSEARTRTVYIFGFARLKVESAADARAAPGVLELTGVGVSLGELIQVGYFRQFEVRLKPGTDSAVVIVRSREEREHLERVLSTLREQNICIISKS